MSATRRISSAGKETDLGLNSKAGLDRTAVTYKDGDSWTFADFEPYGWARTLPDDWFDQLP
jgi:hypothetical protein